MNSFIEKMMFDPKWYHYIIIILLSPLSLVYGLVMYFRRLFVVKRSFGLPIVSIGNLVVGGSGKTPFVIALASRYEKLAVISRGYGRQSKNLVQVSNKGDILCTVEESGDEAMLIAISLPKASVIVSEDRSKAITLAKEQGAELIILDDGFNRVDIEKFEILLEPKEVRNYFPFPAGAFREFWFMNVYADIILKEEKDFVRQVTLEDLSSKMLLVTAISNPQRLDPYLPKNVVGKVYLEDHAYFNEEKLKHKMQEYGAETLLVTEKDRVKMRNFKLPLSKMKLKLEIKDEVSVLIDQYIQTYRNKGSN
jgi:tetraacyldisaccharide 4'-kinase